MRARRVSRQAVGGCCALAAALGLGMAVACAVMGFQPTRSAADGPVAMIVRHTRGGGRSGSASIASDGLAQNIERALIDGQIDEFRYADADENGLLSSQVRHRRAARALSAKRPCGALMSRP